MRAAVGGVTAIQGASQDYPKRAEALIRNVDLLIFGTQVARGTVDFDRLDDDVESIRKGIFDTGTVKAHYVHLAEGQKTNETSVNEFLKFAASPLFSAATVGIHGTAVTRVHFDQLAAVGGKLVWSPQSNLRLYNETTDIVAALAAGVPVALGADWAPSGGPSLLHEMKVARQVLCQTPGHTVRAPDLVRMVTSGAAEIAGLANKIGTLEVGRAADLTILQKRHDDPYENVVSAYPTWVEMVMIGGDLVYGRPDWVAHCRPQPTTKRSRPWGRPCCSIPASAPRRRRHRRASPTPGRDPRQAHRTVSGRRPDLRLTTGPAPGSSRLGGSEHSTSVPGRSSLKPTPPDRGRGATMIDFHPGAPLGTEFDKGPPIASDPGPTERLVGRNLVGDVGQRVQVFLTKLGLTTSYVLVNAFPHAVHPSKVSKALPLLSDPDQLAWRNRCYDLITDSRLEAIIAFGGNAQAALRLWETVPRSPPSRSPTLLHVTAPISPPSGAPRSPPPAPQSPQTPAETKPAPTTEPASPRPTTPASHTPTALRATDVDRR